MPKRAPERVLDDILAKKGKGKALRRKMAANRDNNWLLALTLHSFARLDAGAKLTDLEQAIVTGFEKHGFSEAELKGQGRLNKRLTAQVRKELFPDKFAQLKTANGFSLKDLKKEVPKIARSFLDQPNVAEVDVHAVHAGDATLAELRPDPAAVRERASEALVALPANADTATADTSGARYTIKATRFKCIDRDTDSIFGPSNEPYWIFGAVGADEKHTSRSEIFGDVDSGESRTFKSEDGRMWGPNGAPHPLPDGEIGVLIQLWEHDHGDPSKIQDGVAAAFAAAAAVLTASGVASWVGAVVAGVGAVVRWLLGFLDDDHIADQVFAITRRAIEDRIKKSGQSFTIIKRFTNGDANYTLTVTVSRVA